MKEVYVYNRKILYIILLFLLVIAVIGFKFYLNQKKENSAIRVKIISLDKIKQTPMPWSRLSRESIESINKAAPKKELALPPVPKSAPAEKVITEIPLAEQSTEQLADSLTGNMVNIDELDLATVDKNIEIANEIISREPASYSAYKAKLISLIVKETKFDQEIDDYEFNKVLDSMASFEMTNTRAARREAAILRETNEQLSAFENNLNNILTMRDEISTQSAALDKSSDEFQELQIRDAQLSVSEQMATENLENLKSNTTIETVPTSLQNEDIVEIPFLRLLAKNDYDAVIENAQGFIEQFPNSLTGYYYLAKALALSGREDEMISFIEESGLSPETQNAIQNKIEGTSGQDPKNYWQTLIF